MKLLDRNKQDVWYSNPSGNPTAITDSNGLMTGEYEITYSAPQKLRVSVSISSGANNLGSQGMAELTEYGIRTAYTHRITTEDLNCPITEESLVWYRITPGDTASEVPHNFKVVRKATSLNHIIYYLKEVDVDED